LQNLSFAVALGLVLGLLLLELLLARLFPLLLFFFVLRSQSLELGLTLCGFLLRLGLWSGLFNRKRPSRN
jgi:hypothetical protein